jgi:hypothetical protein
LPVWSSERLSQGIIAAARAIDGRRNPVTAILEVSMVAIAHQGTFPILR